MASGSRRQSVEAIKSSKKSTAIIGPQKSPPKLPLLNLERNQPHHQQWQRPRHQSNHDIYSLKSQRYQANCRETSQVTGTERSRQQFRQYEKTIKHSSTSDLQREDSIYIRRGQKKNFTDRSVPPLFNTTSNHSIKLVNTNKLVNNKKLSLPQTLSIDSSSFFSPMAYPSSKNLQTKSDLFAQPFRTNGSNYPLYRKYSCPENFTHEHSHEEISARGQNPQDVLRNYGRLLTNYERSEIQNYNQIWYFGQKARKIVPIETDDAQQIANNGFNDNKNGYILIKSDHLAYRYEITNLLGKGSFGKVVGAFDHRKQMQVAIKIIKNSPKFIKQARIEASILKVLDKSGLKGNRCFVKLLETFTFRNHPCIVFELLGKNLYEVLKINNFQGFSMGSVRRIAYRILQGLGILHSDRIIHCDLKPENILLKPGSSDDVKIIDFGSACISTECLYTYIQSRFYRAPEVILGLPYSMPIDMWSFGCLLTELLTGHPLFGGSSETEQISLFVDLLGLPPATMLKTAPRTHVFFDNKGRLKASEQISINPPHLVRWDDPLFKDFVMKCLAWQSNERMTPQAAVNHPWLQRQSSHSSRSLINNQRAPLDTCQIFIRRQLSLDVSTTKNRKKSKMVTFRQRDFTNGNKDDVELEIKVYEDTSVSSEERTNYKK